MVPAKRFPHYARSIYFGVPPWTTTHRQHARWPSKIHVVAQLVFDFTRWSRTGPYPNPVPYVAHMYCGMQVSQAQMFESLRDVPWEQMNLCQKCFDKEDPLPRAVQMKLDLFSGNGR